MVVSKHFLELVCPIFSNNSRIQDHSRSFLSLKLLLSSLSSTFDSSSLSSTFDSSFDSSFASCFSIFIGFLGAIFPFFLKFLGFFLLLVFYHHHHYRHLHLGFSFLQILCKYLYLYLFSIFGFFWFFCSTWIIVYWALRVLIE